MSNPEEDVVDTAVIDCNHVLCIGGKETVVLKEKSCEGGMCTYHSEEGLDYEKDEVERDDEEDWKFFLHEFSEEAELEEERFPDEEEEPEDEAEMHHDLDPKSA